MSAFIVISTNNRLHYLVDGIEKSRPLNPAVPINISTGKITESDAGYTYKYTVHGEKSEKGSAKSFSNLLSNQLAAFRLAYSIPEPEIVNIFLLENPLTENDLAESEGWIEEIGKVYGDGLGHDSSFCLYRLIFTYNHDTPHDIVNQIDRDALRRLLNNHLEIVSGEYSTPTFNRYLFYIDNQKSDKAAMCLYKEEHDLKIPRFLVDFMMLASSANDSYNVVHAMSSPTVTTRAFSVGFAESMYYYPDVERYYKHADNRDLHRKFLLDNDETQDKVQKETMNVEKHPFGLRARKNRLAQYYENVPFTENIKNFPESSDLKIDNCIVALKDYLIKERKKEIEEFDNSPKVVSLRKKIKDCEEQISSATKNEDETPEEFDKRVEEIRTEKVKTANELEQLFSSFEPDCPSYIERGSIYTDLCVTDEEEEDKQEKVANYTAEYNQLVHFAKSKKFLNFVMAHVPVLSHSEAEEHEATMSTEENRPGCLFWPLSLLRDKKASQGDVTSVQKTSAALAVGTKLVDNITCIKEQLDLKQTYATFKNDVKAVEDIYSSEKEECDNFKLTWHSNHHYPLINLDELKKTQSLTSEERIKKGISDWKKEEAEPTKASLVSLIEIGSAEYTRHEFPFIDWEDPFPFVKDISDDDVMAGICNKLQVKAAPFVAYNLSSGIEENRVNRFLFSDRPNFADEIEDIREKLNHGNEISTAKSVHIASKICMLEILPLDKDILDNLVDLQENNEIDPPEILFPTGGKELQDSGNIEDWGGG